MLGGSKRNVAASPAFSKENWTSASMGELLRMVIFSEFLGQFWHLYLSTKGEKAAEQTAAFATHRGEHRVHVRKQCWKTLL